VPHHLSKFGGTTFLQYDAFTQPVTEVSSVHGVFEDTLIEKLVGNQVRFGVTSAGDDHTASPGVGGIAGVFVDATAPARRAAFKQALRERRSCGLRRHGMSADVRLNERPMGAEFAHAGDLLLRCRVSEFSTLQVTHGQGAAESAPGDGSGVPADCEQDGAHHVVAASAGAPDNEEQPVLVSISRDGAYGQPVYQRVLPPGGSMDELLVLPGCADDAFYMLRVTRGGNTLAPNETLLWSSPIWVDAEPAAGYPLASIAPSPGTLPAGVPFALALGLSDPDGLANLAWVTLHVTQDGGFLASLPLPLLLPFFAPTPQAPGVALTHPAVLLPPGDWGFVLELRDAQGHVAVAGTTLHVVP
jgi:hypothetical protein